MNNFDSLLKWLNYYFQGRFHKETINQNVLNLDIKGEHYCKTVKLHPDLEKLPHLCKLNIYNTNLEDFKFKSQKLKSLTLNHTHLNDGLFHINCPNLKYVNLAWNHFKEIDFDYEYLQECILSFNKIKTLKIHSPKLTRLYAISNKIKKLNIESMNNKELQIDVDKNILFDQKNDLYYNLLNKGCLPIYTQDTTINNILF